MTHTGIDRRMSALVLRRCFISMIGELILFMLLTIVSRTKGISPPVFVNCIRKEKNWITPDHLLIEWAVPDDLLDKTSSSEVQVEASWFMEENYGECSDATMTSCRITWGPNGSILYHNFYLRVNMTSNNEVRVSVTWRINIKDCWQPPKVGSISVTAPNGSSSCLEVRWRYTSINSEDQYCNHMKMKAYQLIYKPVHEDNRSWSTLQVEPTDSCKGNNSICGLVPYTQYTVGIQCKRVENGSEYGHWSETTYTLARTDEDVPTASPEVTDGGFYYVRRDCIVRKIRKVTFYWKNIPREFRNGELLGVEVDIYQQESNSGTPVKSYSVNSPEISSSVELMCSSPFNISLRSFTAKGSSRAYSSILIPSDSAVLDIDADIVPVVNDSNKNIVIRWVFHSSVSFNITSYTVFWCLKNQTAKCQSNIDWERLLPNQQHYIFTKEAYLQQSHKCIFGLSLQSNTSSSGIIWSRCLYSEDKDIKPPRNVRFSDIKVERTLRVLWDTQSCGGPYVLQYVVQLCVLNEDHGCSDIVYTKGVVGRKNSVSFDQLDPSHQYGVYVRALTLSNISSLQSKLVISQPFTERLNPAGIAGIVSGTVVCGILMIVGFITILRIMRKQCFEQSIPITDILQPEVIREATQDQHGSACNDQCVGFRVLCTQHVFLR